MNTKKCSKCGKRKSLDDYYNCRSARDGKTWHCKKCMRSYAHKRYKTHWAEIKLKRIQKMAI